MNEQKFCQSCGMPLTDEVLGTEEGGAKSADYCEYCYQEGAFTQDVTMEAMIDLCAPHMAQGGMTEEQAVAAMKQWFPQLKRWSAR